MGGESERMWKEVFLDSLKVLYSLGVHLDGLRKTMNTWHHIAVEIGTKPS
jgi:hypothetical protein